MQEAGVATRETTWSIELPHAASAVPIARALIRNVLTEVGPQSLSADCTDTAELLTAELVANAVLHTPAAGAPIRLVVELLPAGCRIEVHDTDPSPVPGLAIRRYPDPAAGGLDENGRGLLLIRTLSAASGFRPTPHGKAVWFRLPGPVR